MTLTNNDLIHEAVREQYAKVAESDYSNNCCANDACCTPPSDNAETTSIGLGYSQTEVIDVPQGSNMGLGCGNPRAIASLKSGETILDLGSGGGFDCFLAVNEVGQSGHIIGVDMTPEMLNKARNNVSKTRHNNVEFRLGEIENLPVADAIIDVIISNCAINLSPQKEKVFKEAYRVLKPGGRLAISDIVAFVELPANIQDDMALFTGCMAGASTILELERMLKNSAFTDIKIEANNKSRDFIRDWLPDSRIENHIVSATIEATKPKL